MVYGEYLRYLRKSRGFSLNKTAKLIGISGQYLSEIERGGRKCLNGDSSAAFSVILGLGPDESERLCVLKEKLLNKPPIPLSVVTFLEDNPDVVFDIMQKYDIE